jgi:3-oxoacyl-[acyl-carrier-protein] synthase-3
MATEIQQARPSEMPVGSSRLGSLLGVQILGLGTCVPDCVVTNEELAARGFDADWILQRTGIRQRRHAPPEVDTSDLATEAASRCLLATGVAPEEVDLLLVATYTPDMPMPSTASLVQERLGLSCMAYDLQAACTGFVFALITGMQFVATGCSRAALVVGADCNSRIVNPDDERIYPIFGDGAGAAVLAAGGPAQGLVCYAVGSDGRGADLLCRPMGGARLLHVGDDDPRRWLHLEGRPIFKWAVRTIVSTVTDVLRSAQLTLDDVDLLVLHQANLRIIDAAVQNLGVDPRKVYNNVDRYGNTAAASIPLALAEAQGQGFIRPGSLVLVSGFGGGLCWGTALLRW